MKKYLSIALSFLLAMVVCTGCLKHGLDDLETFDGADIQSIQGVYYRFTTEQMDPAGQTNQVRQVQLSVGNRVVEAGETSGVASIDARPSSSFPADQLDKISASNLVVVLNLSTAATVHPMDGAPKLGVPGDWSKPNKYRVVAANGDSKEWTVTVNFSK